MVDSSKLRGVTRVPFVVGEGYGPEQMEHLRRVAQRVPHWYVSDCPGDPLPGALDAKGKPDNSRKRPRRAGGGSPGKWENPGSANTLEDVLSSVEAGRGGCVGLLAHSAAPGTVCIDLDKVLVDGRLTRFGALGLASFAPSYVEVSPSGTGLRMVCTGTVSPGVFKRNAVMIDGAAVGIEVYAAGASNRFLRMTGAAVTDAAGDPLADCQMGIDYLLSVLRGEGADNKSGATSTSGKASPGKQNNTSAVGTDATSTSAGSEAKRTGEEAFAALLAYRPAVAPGALLEAMQSKAATQARGKLALSLRCDLKAFDGDHSALDYYVVCEIIRQGADSFASVVEVWSQTKAADRAKFNDHPTYKRFTVDKAVQAVLSECEKHSARGGGSAKQSARALPADFVEALRASGDTVTVNKRGELMGTAGNVYTVLRNDPECVGRLGYNALKMDLERLTSWRHFDRDAPDMPGSLNEEDMTRFGHWLSQKYGPQMEVKKSVLRDGVVAAAKGAEFNPLQDWLLAAEADYDGVPRLSNWLTTYALVDHTGCAEYVSRVSRAVLISAAARAFQPGAKVDTMLVIAGKGGAGKSTLFRILAESIGPNLFTDSVHDITNPVNLVESTVGSWFCELSELTAARRSDSNALKTALTTVEDTYRVPYEAKPKKVGRRFIFIGTTNAQDFIQDEGDNGAARRFWPVTTKASEANRMPLDDLKKVARQIIGEAVRAYLAGERWWITAEDGAEDTQWNAQRLERKERGAYFDELVEPLLTWAWEYVGPADAKSLVDIARLCGDMRSIEGDQASQKRLASTLRSCGMVTHKTRAGARLWKFSPEKQAELVGLRISLVSGQKAAAIA